MSAGYYAPPRVAPPRPNPPPPPGANLKITPVAAMTRRVKRSRITGGQQDPASAWRPAEIPPVNPV